MGDDMMGGVYIQNIEDEMMVYRLVDFFISSM